MQEAARNQATQQPQRIVANSSANYIPAAQRRNKTTQNTSICPNCKQAIPNEEMEQHLRIEMLDPQWREQSRIAQQRSSTTNLSTADVANNLKRLASQRGDVFDPLYYLHIIRTFENAYGNLAVLLEPVKLISSLRTEYRRVEVDVPVMGPAAHFMLKEDVFTDGIYETFTNVFGDVLSKLPDQVPVDNLFDDGEAYY